jgi:hypothetical protein
MPPRDVIKAIPGVEFVEMTHHHEEAHCCGSVLTLIKDPLIAHDIGEMRIGEATAVKAETILALCPCCEFQFRVTKEKKNSPVEIRDLAAFACQGLGKTFADPSDEVSRQWKVFEGIIALHARARRGDDPHARLHEGADAGHDAQGHGQSDASHAAGRRASRRAENDRLSARPGVKRPRQTAICRTFSFSTS